MARELGVTGPAAKLLVSKVMLRHGLTAREDLYSFADGACQSDALASIARPSLRRGLGEHPLGFAIYRASHEDYQDANILSGARSTGRRSSPKPVKPPGPTPSRGGPYSVESSAWGKLVVETGSSAGPEAAAGLRRSRPNGTTTTRVGLHRRPPEDAARSGLSVDRSRGVAPGVGAVLLIARQRTIAGTASSNQLGW